MGLKERVYGSSPEGTFATRILSANNLLEQHYGQILRMYTFLAVGTGSPTWSPLHGS